MSGPLNFHQSLRRVLATSSKDWAQAREDAWIYGIVLGWDLEPEGLMADEDDDAMAELAVQHGWDDSDVERLRMLHAQFVASAEKADNEGGL